MLLLMVNSAFAQWHFSASIVSYNGDCGDSFYAIQAAVEVAVYAGIVEQNSGQTYSSQVECEAYRQLCSITYSNSGCYIRTTTTPCQGNVGGGGSGGFYGEPSQHNSLGIGGEYFSQNETRSVDNRMMENEMMIQNEVLNKNWYNAVGAKTGDKIYDNQYIKQIQQLYYDDDADTDNDYNLRSRPSTDSDKELYVREFKAPSLGSDYYEIQNDSGPTVRIDRDRFLYNDTYMKSFKDEHPEIFAKRTDNNKFLGVETALVDLTNSASKLGSGLLGKLDDAVEFCETNYGVLIPYSEKIGEFKDALDGDLKFAGKALVGDIVGTVSEFGDKVVEEVIDPLKDCAVGLASTTLGAGKAMKNVFTVKDALKETTGNYLEFIKKSSERLVQGKNPDPNNELIFVTVKSEKTIWNAIKDIIKNQ